MSAPIGSATTSSMGLAESQDSSRPQLQSRRVSLKLGPLGITYSTDQVLWSAAAGVAASSVASGALAGASDTVASSANAEDAAAARQAEAQQTAQAEAQQTGRSFSQEMLDAWRKQVSERQANSATYGPNGALTGTGVQDTGEALAMAEESQDTEQENEQQTDQQASQQQEMPQAAPASRMRQAIAAYISCAQNFSAVRPMLTAVA
jgi:hypothetical protein